MRALINGHGRGETAVAAVTYVILLVISPCLRAREVVMIGRSHVPAGW